MQHVLSSWCLPPCHRVQREANIVYVAREKVKGVPHHAKAGNINSCLLKEGPGKVRRLLVLWKAGVAYQYTSISRSQACGRMYQVYRHAARGSQARGWWPTHLVAVHSCWCMRASEHDNALPLLLCHRASMCSSWMPT